MVLVISMDSKVDADRVKAAGANDMLKNASSENWDNRD